LINDEIRKIRSIEAMTHEAARHGIWVVTSEAIGHNQRIRLR